jgi:hypothetical protein
MALQGYFDDSASKVGKRPFVLAGFVSSVEQWGAFSSAWKEKLKQEPRLAYFKMSEAMAFRGQFSRGWTPALRDQRIFELAEIILAFAQVSVQSAIWASDFDDVIMGIHPAVDKPYFLCLYQLIFSIYTYQIEHSDVECEIIFDTQSDLAPRAFQEWKKAQEVAPTPERRELMNSMPVFRDDKTVLPLQAADMYAWLIRHNYEQGESNIVCKAAMKVLNELPVIARAWNRDELWYYGARMMVSNARENGVL